MTSTRPIREVVIGNKRWKFVRAIIRERGPKGERILGRCDPPEKKSKAITVDKRLKGKLELDTCIHEFTHAPLWDVLSEEFVERFSTDLTNYLWRIGYRKLPEDECQE